MLGPILHGEALTLQPVKIDDLPMFCRWFSDMELTRYLLLRFPMTQDQEDEWYRAIASSRDSVHWSIVVGGSTIGNTAIRSIDWVNRNADTGTIIGDRSQWGKGYGSESVHLRTAFAFRELGLERLETESFAENVPMHRALAKSGYRQIGTRRRQFYREGRWHDGLIFEILRDEWLERGD